MDKFRIRKRKEYLATIFGLAGIFLIYFMVFNLTVQKQIYFSPGEGIQLPQHCSESEIKKAWDSIFKESSNGIIIINNSECTKLYSYKNSSEELFILIAYKNSENSLLAIHGNFNKSLLEQINSKNLEVIAPGEFQTMFSNLIESDYSKKANIRISSLNLTQANSTFNSIIKIIGETWTEKTDSYNQTRRIFDYTKETTNYFESGRINSNNSLEELYISITPIQTCLQNWIEKETYCINKTKTIYYIDERNCENVSGRPPNKTEDCSGINSKNTEITLKVDSTNFNYSKEYNGTSKIEIFGEGEKLVEFEWNFTKEATIDGVEIIKEENTSIFGYTFVNGLNVTKNIYVNKLNIISNRICIIDDIVKNISEFSADCNTSKETELICPGNDSKYTCNITENKFEITGLTHSGAIEISDSFQSCIPSWIFGPWSSCLDFQQTRTAIDSNNCGISADNTLLVQSCSPPCNEDWKCGNWTPEKCPKNQTQSRNCLDANSCGTTTTKPIVEQSCQYQDNFTLGITILIIFLIIAIMGAIAFYLINSQNSSKTILENLGYETNSPGTPTNPNNPELKRNIPPNSDPRRFYK